MNELIFHNVAQDTDEWLHVKAGKFSGTDAAMFTVNGKSQGGIGSGLKSLIRRKVGELVVGPDLDGFSSKSMERGKALEPVARKQYEMENFADVDQMGFIQRGDYTGFSPDGLVGDDGLIEIKCLEAAAFVDWIDTEMETGDIDKKHYCQMQWALFVSDRQWCDYVVYHPGFGPAGYTQTRVYRDEEMIRGFNDKMKFVESEMIRLQRKIMQISERTE